MFRELDVGQSALLTDIAMCINYYRLFSPGLYCCIHATVQLDDDTRLCAGIIVQVNHGQLKQCDPGPDYDYFRGPPNFVLDVFPGDGLLDYEYRRDCFERAVKLQSGYADALANLGNVLQRLGRAQDAAVTLRRAVAANAKAPQAHNLLGAALLDLGDARGAVRAFEEAVKLQPGRADFLSNLASAHLRNGDPQSAIGCCDKALALEADNAAALGKP